MRKSKLLSIIVVIIGAIMLILGLFCPMPETFIGMKILLMVFRVFFLAIGGSILRSKGI